MTWAHTVASAASPAGPAGMGEGLADTGRDIRLEQHAGVDGEIPTAFLPGHVGTFPVSALRLCRKDPSLTSLTGTGAAVGRPA